SSYFQAAVLQTAKRLDGWIFAIGLGPIAFACSYLGSPVAHAGSSRRRAGFGRLADQRARRTLLGLTLLVMAIIALPPGASPIVGLLIGWPAIQLILGHDKAALPLLLALFAALCSLAAT